MCSFPISLDSNQFILNQASYPQIEVNTKQDVNKQFKSHPDFIEFFSVNNLEDVLSFFDHKIVNDTNTNEPLINCNGKCTPWSQVKEELFGKEKVVSFKLPHGWKYNEQGIVKKNCVKWTILEPDWKDKVDPKPGEHFVELVSEKKGCCGVSRHCWLRLIDDKTNVTSVGFCGKMYKFFPIRGQKGKLVSPDPCEFHNKEVKKYCTRIKVTNVQYEALKNKIENDQNNKNLYFNLQTRNCSMYAVEVLKTIGINIDNREYPSQALARWAFSWMANIKTPKCITTALHYIAQFFRIILSPFYSLLLLGLGGAYTDKDITELEKQYGDRWAEKPNKPFTRWLPLLDGSILQFGTVWKVTEWQRVIDNERSSAMAKIQQEWDLKPNCSAEEAEQFKKRIDEARYAMPSNLEAAPLGFRTCS